MTTNTRSTSGKSNMFAPDVPSVWQRLQQDPLLFIAKWLYGHRPPASVAQPTSMPAVKVVCISDTHNEQPRSIPHGDILIHAGDLTVNGTVQELQKQLDWLDNLPHKHKIVIAGNHDVILDPTYFLRNPRAAGSTNTKRLCWGSITYLCKSSATLDIRGRSYCIYGSPMTPKYGNWAFQYPEGEDVWSNTVPEATDILVTHGPAKGHLDSSPSNPSYLQGCAHLQREIWRVKPRVHVCGHIHSARGVEHGNWGWLRWGYDAVCSGEGGGVGAVLRMLAAWVWLWLLCMLGVKDRQTMTSVNAAVVGDQELAEGEQIFVIDLL